MTAIGWLEQEFIKLEATTGVHGKMYELIEQAKEMERKQHSKTWDKALDAFEARGHNFVRAWEDFDEHFKQFSLYEHKETITSADTITSSQTEISDEEIEKEANNLFAGDLMWSERIAFKVAIKWYREQLKKKQ